jgi:hypothetical protein
MSSTLNINKTIDKARDEISKWPDWKKLHLFGKVIMSWEKLVPESKETCSEIPDSLKSSCKTYRRGY